MKTLLHSITQPVVCATCCDEFLAGGTDAKSLQEYGQLDVGFTGIGIQVWCRRHGVNVVHIDFDGETPQADFRSLIPKE